MPGRNCCINGCGSCDSKAHKENGIRFLQIPTCKGPGYPEWKKELLNVISKFRVMGKDDIQRFNDGKMYICTLHFEGKDIYITSKFFNILIL